MTVYSPDKIQNQHHMWLLFVIAAVYVLEQHEETGGKFSTLASVTVAELATATIHVAEGGQFDEEEPE